MNQKGQAFMEFTLEYGWAILASIIVIAVLAIWFKPSSLLTANIDMNNAIQCSGEKLCENFANSNYSSFKDSLTGNNEMDIYCQKIINNYTTQQFTFHISDKNKLIAEKCQNATG
jgi:uncharacterized protein (UPF0333 family)